MRKLILPGALLLTSVVMFVIISWLSNPPRDAALPVPLNADPRTAERPICLPSRCYSNHSYVVAVGQDQALRVLRDHGWTCTISLRMPVDYTPSTAEGFSQRNDHAWSCDHGLFPEGLATVTLYQPNRAKSFCYINIWKRWSLLWPTN